MKIHILETTSVLVFIEPKRLREIADCLEAQEQRYAMAKERHLAPLNPTPEGSICHLRGEKIDLFFRIPQHNEALGFE